MNSDQLRRTGQAAEILAALGLPPGQHNERSALVFLALLNLKSSQSWRDAQNPLCRIVDLMKFIGQNYGREYAANTRETVRKESIHHFVEAGLVLKNPDSPSRPNNSPKTAYQIEPILLDLIRKFGSENWLGQLDRYRISRTSLRARYARERSLERVPLRLPGGQLLRLSPGGQSLLVKRVLDDFCAYFTPGAEAIYVGDTADKFAFFAVDDLQALGVTLPEHGQMPDVVVHLKERNWLILIEAVDSRGPIDAKRRNELERLFVGCSAGLVFVTAFADRKTAARFLPTIAWETEVWIADAPTHLIHFNGERFLGPY